MRQTVTDIVQYLIAAVITGLGAIALLVCLSGTASADEPPEVPRLGIIRADHECVLRTADYVVHAVTDERNTLCERWYGASDVLPPFPPFDISVVLVDTQDDGERVYVPRVSPDGAPIVWGPFANGFARYADGTEYDSDGPVYGFVPRAAHVNAFADMVNGAAEVAESAPAPVLFDIRGAVAAEVAKEEAEKAAKKAAKKAVKDRIASDGSVVPSSFYDRTDYNSNGVTDQDEGYPPNPDPSKVRAGQK